MLSVVLGKYQGTPSLVAPTDSTRTPLGVACCNCLGILSWVSSQRGSFSFVSAVAFCRARGLGLCTVAQVQAATDQELGAVPNGRLLWTSDFCDKPATPPVFTKPTVFLSRCKFINNNAR